MTKSAARKRSPKFSFGSKFDLLPGLMNRLDQFRITDSSSIFSDMTPKPECSVTEKKGQEDIIGSSSDCHSVLEYPMIEYAEILLMLASSEPKPEEPNVTLPEISSLTKKIKGEEVFENKTQILDSPKRVDKGEGTSLALKLEEEYLYTQISKSSKIGRLKRKIGKKLKFKETEDDDVEEDKTKKSEYKCSICNRIFQSYQALGGHIAFHYKNQRIKNKNSVKSSISALEEHEPITEVDETEKVIHQCKTFPSPSVSSGVNIQRSVKSNQINNSSEETIQTFPRVVLHFSLNDLPHVEYEQGN